MNTNPLHNSLLEEIVSLVDSLQQLSKQALEAYSPLVDAVIQEQSRDHQRIERLLDGMLDFCSNDAMLLLYKKLCRYYFTINPTATAEYIYAYRDMWDSSTEGDQLGGLNEAG